MRTSIAALSFLFASLTAAFAQTAAPLLEPRPLFVSGYYETESRNSHFPKSGPKAKVCISSVDFDAFQKETIDQYKASPQFMKACRLSSNLQTKDGFAFAMDCGRTRVTSVFHFSKDMVVDETRTEILDSPKTSSNILTIMRRVGECPDGQSGRGI